MWRCVVVLVGCGASTEPESKLEVEPRTLADHALHDLTSEGAYARHVRLTGHAVPAADLPALRDALTLPVSGAVDVAIDLVLPGRDLRAAHGAIDVGCTRCRIGDDRARLQPGGYFGDIDFGHVTVDHLAAHIVLANGAAELARWTLASPDLDVELAMRAELARDWASSPVRGCLRYRVKPDLRRRAPRTAAMFEITGALLAEDGFFQIALEGNLGEIKRLARQCSVR